MNHARREPDCAFNQKLAVGQSLTGTDNGHISRNQGRSNGYARHRMVCDADGKLVVAHKTRTAGNFGGVLCRTHIVKVDFGGKQHLVELFPLG